MENKVQISYTRISVICEDIAKRILKKNPNVDKIIAITRGGMVPACIIANLLGIKNMDSIALSSYNEENLQGELKVLNGLEIEDSPNNLFVDDLVDSGNTYFYIKNNFPNSMYVALFSKKSTPKNIKLDAPTQELNAGTWIEFPWELPSIKEKLETENKMKALLYEQFDKNKIEMEKESEAITSIETEKTRNNTEEEAKENNLPEEKDTPLKSEKIETIDGSSVNSQNELTREEKQQSLDSNMEEFDVNKDYEFNGYPLTKEQKRAINFLLNKRKQLTVLTGKAGAGKSTIIKFIRNIYPSWKLLATTGKAALLIGASTLDSFFCYDRESNKIVDDKILIANMKKIGPVIIIDEASMVGKSMFEVLYSQCIRFGKDLILVGDWGQASPVKDDWIFRSKTFVEDAVVIKLTECHRQSNMEFLEVLDKVRTGNIDEQVSKAFTARIQPTPPNKEEGYVVLYPFNKLVDDYNEEKVKEVAEELGVSTFTLDSKFIQNKGVAKVSIESQKSYIKNSNLADNELICLGCQIVITRNNIQAGYCNGDTGIITEQGSEGYHVLLKRNNREVVVNELKIEVKNAKDEIIGWVQGYPIRAGYALTIHKCQGMTLPKAWVDLNSLDRMHSHGLAYVALSRVRSIEDLLINNWSPTAIVCEQQVRAFL